MILVISKAVSRQDVGVRIRTDCSIFVEATGIGNVRIVSSIEANSIEAGLVCSWPLALDMLDLKIALK